MLFFVKPGGPKTLPVIEQREGEHWGWADILPATSAKWACGKRGKEEERLNEQC